MSVMYKNLFLKNHGIRRLSCLPRNDLVPKKYEGPNYETVTKLREKYITPCLTTFYKKPLLLNEGHMQWLYDHEGRRYLDFFGGICTVSVGHCHPKVVEALQEQIKQLWHISNVYLHKNIHEYTEMLASKLPGDLKVVYLVNSGSEANDLATMMARLHTGNKDLISLRNGYHGMTTTVMELTALSHYKYPVPSGGSGVHHAMNPDPYTGIWGGKNCRDSPIQTTRDCNCTNHCEASEEYYKQLEDMFKSSIPVGKVAGMFAESIQGVGGVVQYPKGFIKKAQDLIHANGGVFISDEVQTGFGRLGDHFWGFESHGIIPDIVTMAKGIGNGFPLAAVVTTPKIAQSLTKAAHFNTFGGNPMACAVGKAVLQVIKEEKTQELSKDIGEYLLPKLASLREIYAEVGDVRGKGLMIGVEMVQRETKLPLQATIMTDILEESKDMGLLLGRGGRFGNVLRIKPPMCITKDDSDYAIDVLENVFKKLL